MDEGPEAGLVLVDALEAHLVAYPYLHATRADLLRRLDRRDEAVAAYRRARELTTADGERRYLDRRLTALTAP
jgi:RNA polymerase sigma-70 factor (ECF subfamily)